MIHYSLQTKKLTNSYYGFKTRKGPLAALRPTSLAHNQQYLFKPGVISAIRSIIYRPRQSGLVQKWFEPNENATEKQFVEVFEADGLISLPMVTNTVGQVAITIFKLNDNGLMQQERVLIDDYHGSDFFA